MNPIFSFWIILSKSRGSPKSTRFGVSATAPKWVKITCFQIKFTDIFEISKFQYGIRKFHGKTHQKHWGHIFLGQGLGLEIPLTTISGNLGNLSDYNIDWYYQRIWFSSRPKQLLRIIKGIQCKSSKFRTFEISMIIDKHWENIF